MRVDVVADAEQQVAVEVEVEAAAGVAGLVGPRPRGDLDDQLLRGRVDRCRSSPTVKRETRLNQFAGSLLFADWGA